MDAIKVLLKKLDHLDPAPKTKLQPEQTKSQLCVESAAGVEVDADKSLALFSPSTVTTGDAFKVLLKKVDTKTKQLPEQPKSQLSVESAAVEVAAEKCSALVQFSKSTVTTKAATEDESPEAMLVLLLCVIYFVNLLLNLQCSFQIKSISRGNERTTLHTPAR